jgi:hypothetical protein
MGALKQKPSERVIKTRDIQPAILRLRGSGAKTREQNSKQNRNKRGG